MTPPFLNGFAPNLIQTPRIRSLDISYPQNSYPTKSKMAADAILKITFLAIIKLVQKTCTDARGQKIAVWLVGCVTLKASGSRNLHWIELRSIRCKCLVEVSWVCVTAIRNVDWPSALDNATGIGWLVCAPNLCSRSNTSLDVMLTLLELIAYNCKQAETTLSKCTWFGLTSQKRG